ncbi:alpha/beta hydrolase [Hymenobacter sp. ASUV-10]|uniref:Alpha/beta hydrolase n=1 Tax=Hymenobacter aranciens TaxID=3063996 RepID=A0ABT9B5N2_9BACT|nr:alpha/beta hydrolase [Hymenobacter sp. ASUV-10]MDO7873530.1 alpha/beta hydrolase [Hymenobacter sp. ASUV-10]
MFPVSFFRRSLTLGGRLLLPAALLLSLASCDNDDDENVSPNDALITTSTAKPAFAPDIDDQMWAVVDQFIKFGTPPLPTLTPRQARMAPSVTDAVETLLANNDQSAEDFNLTITQQVIPGSYTPQSAPDGLLVRIYKPAGATGTLPAIVYYHGGGWVIGSLDVYEPSCKALAQNTGAVVVSLDYRLAPEAKFPAAHEDAFAAYKWMRKQAATLGIDSNKIAVAGESAGGNMAVGVCLLAKERNVAQPRHILAVYPVSNNDLTTASYQQYANAVPLNKANVEYFTGLYFNSPADGDNRLISLTDVANLQGLPATTIIGAQIDLLQTEGAQLRDKLTAAGVTVNYQLYQGTTHEFFGTYDVVPKAAEAQTYAADRLKAAFQ